MSYSDNKLTDLQQALQLTQAMLDFAKQQNWTDLETLEKQRDDLLKTLFPVSEAVEETEQFTTTLQLLISTNDQLIAHCQQGKHALQMQMRGTKFNQKAVTAYQSN